MKCFRLLVEIFEVMSWNFLRLSVGSFLDYHFDFFGLSIEIFWGYEFQLFKVNSRNVWGYELKFVEVVSWNYYGVISCDFSRLSFGFRKLILGNFQGYQFDLRLSNFLRLLVVTFGIISWNFLGYQLELFRTYQSESL